MNKKTIHKISSIICYVSLAILWSVAIIFYQQQEGRLLAAISGMICLISACISDYTDDNSILF